MGLIQTPVETYSLKGIDVDVKRDDLVGDGNIFPRWAKIEGIKKILESDSIDKSKPLTHLSVYGSWTGWTLSKLCKDYDIEFISAYPNTDRFPKILLERVEGNGGKLHPMRPNMMAFMQNKLNTQAKENGWQQLPYAFNHPAYISYMGDRMKEVLKDRDYDNLVVSIGSGVTASGLIKEFLEYGDDWWKLDSESRKVYSITMSAFSSTKKILNENHAGDLKNIILEKSPYAFDDMMDDYEVPFDCNEFWDKKQWYWLEQNIEKLKGKTLFWNIGGSYLKSINEKK